MKTKLNNATMPSRSGDGMKQEWKKITGKNGITKFVKGELVDFYEKTQAAAEGVTVEEIMQRYNPMNPIELHQREAIYADIASAPHNIFEANDQIQRAKTAFDALPVDEKNLYNNNYMEFLSKVIDGSVVKMTEDFYKSKQPKEEVKVEEATK